MYCCSYYDGDDDDGYNHCSLYRILLRSSSDNILSSFLLIYLSSFFHHYISQNINHYSTIISLLGSVTILIQAFVLNRSINFPFSFPSCSSSSYSFLSTFSPSSPHLPFLFFIMAHYLPTSIMNMFAPRPLLEFKPPIELRKMPEYTGIAQV